MNTIEMKERGWRGLKHICPSWTIFKNYLVYVSVIWYESFQKVVVINKRGFNFDTLSLPQSYMRAFDNNKEHGPFLVDTET